MRRFTSGTTDQYIYFVAVDSTDLKTRETGLSSFTVYRARNGGAAAAYTTPTVAEVDATNMPGVYSLLLDEDMTIASGNDSEEVVLHITQASMAPVTLVYELYRPKVTEGETLTVASGGLNAAMGTGVITAGSIAADAIGASELAADAVAEIADAVWDEDATAHQTQGTFGQAIGDPAADTNSIYKAVVTDATGATVGVDVVALKAETAAILVDTAEIGAAGAGLTALASQASVNTIDDFLDTEIAAILAAVDTEVAAILADTNELQTDWVNGGRLDLLIDAIKAKTDNLPAAPAATGDIPSAASIADAVWDEAIAGHAGVGSTGEALSAAGSAGDPWATALPGAYGAGTAGKIIGDNLDTTVSSRASQTSVDTVDNFLDTEVAAILEDTGTTIPAQIASLNDLSAAQVNAEVVDALNTDTYAEPGQGTPGATLSLAAKIGYLYKAWRNKKTVTATTFSLFNDDEATVDQKSSVSDAAGTFTEAEKTTGP